MTNQEIFELIAHFDHSTVQAMKLTMKDFSIELNRGGAPARNEPVDQNHVPDIAPASSPSPSDLFIQAPLVGTYHASPAAGQPPFVSAGERVHKGQTVCLIEAMKMMSEIIAPYDCDIEEILQQDGALVAFEAPLFRCRKAETC